MKYEIDPKLYDIIISVRDDADNISLNGEDGEDEAYCWEQALTWVIDLVEGRTDERPFKKESERKEASFVPVKTTSLAEIMRDIKK